MHVGRRSRPFLLLWAALCLISPRVRVRVCVRIRVGNPNFCVETPEPGANLHVTNGQTVEKEIHHDGRILSRTGSLSPLQGFCHVLLYVGYRCVKSLCFSIYVCEVLRFCARRKSNSTSFLYQSYGAQIFVFKNDGHNSNRLYGLYKLKLSIHNTTSL